MLDMTPKYIQLFRHIGEVLQNLEDYDDDMNK